MNGSVCNAELIKQGKLSGGCYLINSIEHQSKFGGKSDSNGHNTNGNGPYWGHKEWENFITNIILPQAQNGCLVAQEVLKKALNESAEKENNKELF